MTLTFLQGQAIYQILHILVSITQPIVESGYFSRFIWPSGEVDSFFFFNLTSHPLNALDSGQTLIVPGLCRWQERICQAAAANSADELWVSSCNCLLQFFSPLVFFSIGFFPATSFWVFLSSTPFIHLTRFNDEELCFLLLSTSLSKALCSFLAHVTFHYLIFVIFLFCSFPSVTLPHTLSLYLSFLSRW